MILRRIILPENTLYFNRITDARALRLDRNEVFDHNVTISLETQEDLAKDNIFSYIEENIPQFLTIVRYLTEEDQDLLLSYYLLSKTQNTLAVVHRTTQTLCSFLIRKAVERVGTYLLLGIPTEEVMGEILTKVGMENYFDNVKLSKVIVAYEKTRSFKEVADAYNLHRPSIRRALRKAVAELSSSRNSKEKALGAFIHGLIEKSSARGKGFSKRKLAKQGHIFLSDPPILGQFRVQIENSEFDQVFVSRANK